MPVLIQGGPRNIAAGAAFRQRVPRFFFNLYDDLVSIDPEGTELADLQAAHRMAVCSAREIGSAEVLQGHLNLSHRIEVADEGGEVIETVHFRDTIDIVA